MKKKLNYLTLIPVATLSVGLITGYVRLQAQAENTKVKVEEVDKKVAEIEKEGTKELEEVKKENQEVEKSLTEMRVQQIYMQKSMDTLNENLKELLVEIKDNKKKK